MTPRIYKRELNRINRAIAKIEVILAMQDNRLDCPKLRQYRLRYLADLQTERLEVVNRMVNLKYEDAIFLTECE